MKWAIFLTVFLLSSYASADECTSSEDYQVCTKSETEANGDSTTSSYDTDGNTYSVTTGTREHADGVSESFSSDSDGNEYSVKSWCDTDGCHTTDTDGNSCTITTSGESIGC